MKMLKYLAFTQITLVMALLVISCSITADTSQKNVRGEWRISSSSAEFGRTNAIAMLDENNWWAAKNSTLLYSANSGKEWEIIYELLQQSMIGPKQLGRIEKIQFLDRKVGWLLAVNLMFTEDGGRNWKEVYFDSAKLQGKVPVLRSFHFIDHNRGWVVGNILEGRDEMSSAALWETLDGGKHWRQIKCLECDEREVFWGLDVSKEGEVWVVGNIIYRKAPGTDRLQEMKIDLATATSQLTSVGVTKSNVIWAEVADGKSYYISYDRGNSWTEVKLDRASDRIILIDDQQAYLVSNGEVYSSKDKGKNWNVEIRGGYRQLYFNSDHQLVVAIGQQIAVKQLD